MASNALDAQKWADFFQFLFIAVQHFNVTQMRRGVQKSHCREQYQYLLLKNCSLKIAIFLFFFFENIIPQRNFYLEH